MMHEQFYRELGRYLYALALSDGFIQKRERRKLDKAVTHALKGLCGKYSQQGELVLSKLSFHNCEKQGMTARDAEKSFLDFISEHADKIEEDDKQMAYTLIHKLANAWGGVRRKESVMEKAVHDILDKAGNG